MKAIIHAFSALVLLSAISSPALAKIYKYTDANGKIRYTDKPVRNAKQVKVKTYKSKPKKANETKKKSKSKQTGWQTKGQKCSFDFQSVETKAMLSMLASCASKDGYKLKYAQIKPNNSKKCKRIVYKKKPWGKILATKLSHCGLTYSTNGKVIIIR